MLPCSKHRPLLPFIRYCHKCSYWPMIRSIILPQAKPKRALQSNELCESYAMIRAHPNLSLCALVKIIILSWIWVASQLSIHTYPNQPEIEEQAARFLNVLAPPPAISLPPLARRQSADWWSFSMVLLISNQHISAEVWYSSCDFTTFHTPSLPCHQTGAAQQLFCHLLMHSPSCHPALNLLLAALLSHHHQ